jgi:hypothetical protein
MKIVVRPSGGGAEVVPLEVNCRISEGLPVMRDAGGGRRRRADRDDEATGALHESLKRVQLAKSGLGYPVFGLTHFAALRVAPLQRVTASLPAWQKSRQAAPHLGGGATSTRQQGGRPPAARLPNRPGHDQILELAVRFE